MDIWMYRQDSFGGQQTEVLQEYVRKNYYEAT